jgi:hypothetical protein
MASAYLTLLLSVLSRLGDIRVFNAIITLVASVGFHAFVFTECFSQTFSIEYRNVSFPVRKAVINPNNIARYVALRSVRGAFRLSCFPQIDTRVTTAEVCSSPGTALIVPETRHTDVP